MLYCLTKLNFNLSFVSFSPSKNRKDTYPNKNYPDLTSWGSLLELQVLGKAFIGICLSRWFGLCIKTT